MNRATTRRSHRLLPDMISNFDLQDPADLFSAPTAPALSFVERSEKNYMHVESPLAKQLAKEAQERV